MFSHTWCTDNNGLPVYDADVERFISVKPSARQLAFNEMKYYNFIHFGVNTFTDREWGDGTEDPAVFDPTELDTDQWCEVLKASGSKGIIMTAKHHDGFCLFDSKYTDHTVMHSPYGKDVLKQLSESCKKYGLKMGIYFSPWDRHDSRYGTDEYNDLFVDQLTELCLNYGDVFCYWFDGACGEGPNGKKQVYDWERYYATIRKYQPDAVIAVSGPDVRWIGNEAGKVRSSEWSVIPWTTRTISDVAENSQKSEDEGVKMLEFDKKDEDLGSRAVIADKADLVWSPAEADLSITLGWFWHNESYYINRKDKNNGVRTPEYLADVYFNTVGGNASMLLNVPPDKRGLISDREIGVLKGFKRIIDTTFAEETDFALSVLTLGDSERTLDTVNFMLQNDEPAVRLRPEGKFRTIVMEEDIRCSQRVESFEIYADGRLMTSGTVIGSGKIIRFEEDIDAGCVDILITGSRSNPVIKSIKLYK